MSDLFLVPTGNPRAKVNFERTIRRRVPLSDLEGLTPAAAKLARSVKGPIWAWGTKRGKEDRNVGKWSAIKPRDWVLFYFDGLYPVAGRVLLREHSPAVAERLWGEDGGETWEYLYLLDAVKQVDIPRAGLNEEFVYEPDSFPRGFSRVNRRIDNVEQVLERLSGVGHQLRLAIEAARVGDEMEAAAALDRLSSEMPEEQLRREIDAFDSSDPPESRETVTETLVRNRKLVKTLKELYRGQCQCCGFTFIQANGNPYSEAAHLKPMALREADLDVKDNLLILCPNHHKMLDYGALRIERDEKTKKLVWIVGGEAKPLTDKHLSPGA